MDKLKPCPFCKGKVKLSWLIGGITGIKCGERDEQYGNPEDNFSLIAQLWEPYLRRKCVGAGADVCICGEEQAGGTEE